ncbi:hypothetical protein O6H91_10G067900 [Diphasiastrum complanatum]|uniref:Uncharacterized protein n=5 Tax=Diphasiastrum complanatum TaxID=34168 RepID=A0ACC2CHY6_DIPCM|nr:hypothetical protein O6H91_10G067900 [Diphasiastrum complanatum]KAJ7541634.1 hypothetical protein O6H91_10G067900 [Diphasiastrum complanatum]KAJ7541635.1 hypothetical protein O6H91_10G067900 [Diphasiastrum complanatum]KAJ7541636.1 hypothetical protein O6H91_10G067900 [Diphasiastrum complanatum]
MMGSDVLPLWSSTNGFEDRESEKSLLEDVAKIPSMGTKNGVISNTMNGSTNGLLSQMPISNPWGSVRRAHSNRSMSGSRPGNEAADVELGGQEKEVEKPVRERPFAKSRHQPITSGLAYCLCSCSMILLNKIVLSGYNLDAGISLMFYQNLVSVVLVSILSLLGVINTEPITWKLVRVWLPVNLIFVGMLVSSIYSLKYMNVAMVTILKNVTNMITALGEMYLFHKHHNQKVWGSLILMVISATCGGITDLSFHGLGYGWQIVNCFLTAGYSLTLRKVMDLAKQVTKSGSLNEFSMVLLNNLLSLPLGLGLILVFQEAPYLLSSPVLRLPVFWAVATLSGLFGLAISFTSMWFLHQTSPTTYSLVGSLNKIPLSLAGIMLFRVPTSVPNLLSIFFGLFAGVLFALAKISS